MASGSATTESNNTLLGTFTDIGATTFGSTAIGFKAKVTQSNSLVLGAVNGVNGATGRTRVGIGTTTPFFSLDVRGDGSTADYLSFSAYNVDTKDKGFLVRAARGTPTAPSATQANDFLFNLYAQGADGVDYSPAGAITMAVDGTVSAGKVPGRIVMQTADATGTIVERMRIDSSGNVGIGTSAPTQRLTVNGNILATGTITPSDLRLKHDT